MSKHKRKYVVPPGATKATHYHRLRVLKPQHQSALDYLKAFAEDVGIAPQCNTCTSYQRSTTSCARTGRYQYDLGLCLKWDPGVSSAEQVTLDF